MSLLEILKILLKNSIYFKKIMFQELSGFLNLIKLLNSLKNISFTIKEFIELQMENKTIKITIIKLKLF